MLDYQDIANGIGATLRAAEASALNEGATATKLHLDTLHDQLGEAFKGANELLTEAGHDELDWDAIAGNSAKSGGAQTHSGGTGKSKPE